MTANTQERSYEEIVEALAEYIRTGRRPGALVPFRFPR